MTDRQLPSKTLAEQLRERGNGDLLDGYEDKTSRGMLDLEVAAEIDRLQGLLDSVDELASHNTTGCGTCSTVVSTINRAIPPAPETFPVEMHKSYPALHAALCDLSDAIGNPALEVTRDSTFEVELIKMATGRLMAMTSSETNEHQATTEDRAYYEGARQAAAMAHQSLQALDKWIAGGCGNRVSALKAYEQCSRCGGTGLSTNADGDIDECNECGGNTVTPANGEASGG